MVKLSNRFFRNSENENFSFFQISRISSDFWSFGKNILFGIVSKFPVVMESVVVAYSLTSTDIDREVLGSKPTIVSRNLYRLEKREKGFLKFLLRFTRTCTTYVTFFDVKFEHSNLEGPFCELLSHTTSLTWWSLLLVPIKNDDQESCDHSKADVYRRCHVPISGWHDATCARR